MKPSVPCRLPRRLSMSTALLIGLALLGQRSPPAAAAVPELRGTWLTTTASDDLAAANIATTMASLKRVGLNTVYVESWKNGSTNFVSPTLQAFTGSASLNPALGGRNLLEETRSAAAAAGLVHGAWFEYGLMAQFLGSTGMPSNPLAVKARDNGWLLQDSAGNFTNSSNAFAWLNPLVPEVRELIKGITVDAIRQFDLQIVQFDDHLAWPVQFGYDDYTRNAYRSETGRNVPASFSDSRFVAWRQGKMEAFVTELVGAIRAAKPDVVVSLAPSPAAFSAANFATDWPRFMAAGLFDEVVPQVYRSTHTAFAPEWSNQLAAAGGVSSLAAGLRLLGTGAATPWDDLRQMIDTSRASGALGHSIWYSEGVSNSGTSNPANYHAQLTATYDVAGTGIAANPHFQSVRWAGADGAGGSGTWSLLGPQWKDRSTIWVSSAEGIFDGVGGTVTVSGSVMAERGLDFRTSGYTLAGGTLGLRGITQADNRLTVAAGATATLATVLTGSTGLTKTGGGTLVLDAANSFTGTVTVADGTLRIAHDDAVAGSGVILPAGGTLEIATGVTMQVPSLSLTGGRLDIGRGRIVIAPGGIAEADLRAALIAGRADGSFSGTSGIVTSGGPASETSPASAIGYRMLPSGEAVVAWAPFGDANLDGLVNSSDITLILAGGKFGTLATDAGWAQGDFNYDGRVNSTDINLLLAAGLLNRPPAPAAIATVAVPEPATGLPALLGMLLGPRWFPRNLRYAWARRF